ncbi:MAG: hypothetical protein AABX29_07450 [Nanoarchaeota archaeon]
MPSEKGFTTIRISNRTKKILDELGKKNESYDDLIFRLLKK